jgi:hypothetical protein
MKRNYFFSLLFTLVISGFLSLSFAADWYISATGNDDTGDGLTPATAWASFSKAHTAAAASDVIHVSGMIDFSVDPANTTLLASTTTNCKAGIVIAKSLTIQGTSSSTDGFDGKGLTRFLQITSAGHTVTLKNLKLYNGTAQSTTLAAGGGAITISNGNIVAENVVFDGNSTTGNAAITGGAIYVGGTNSLGTYFKNCVFINNWADKAGAIYFNNWGAGTASVPSIVQFEGCAFVANEAKVAFGGSAMLIRSANNYTTLNIINCTITKNKVHHTSANGGAINLGAKAMASTNVNIINSTITENTTAGSATNSAGVYMLNTTANCIGNLYIKNSIIEGNTAADGSYADLGVGAISPLTPDGGSASVPGYIKIENSIIGRIATDPLRIPAENVPVPNHYNYLTTASTSADLIAGLAPFNTSNNSYALYVGSAAIDYGNSAFLASYSTTDQLGNTRPFTNNKCYAGSIETAPLATAPKAPTNLVAVPGEAQISVEFTPGADGGSAITNYKYSIDGGDTFIACDPAQTASPVVITGLTNGTEYTVILKAVNAIGDGAASAPSNAVTLSSTTGLDSEMNSTIVIYRNGNNQLVINSNTATTGTVSIYNALGQRVAHTNLKGTSTIIDNPMNPGVYVILLNADGKTSSSKIIL